MAAKDLPNHLIDAGAKLLAALDAAGLHPQGAAWIVDHALGEWRYVVATSLVETLGRSKVYKQLLTLMTKLDMPKELTMQDIHLVSPDGSLFKTIAGTVPVEDRTTAFKDCVVNGTKFDAVVYRWIGTPSPDDAAKVERQFKRRAKELAG
jgi:hypothetical protein